MSFTDLFFYTMITLISFHQQTHYQLSYLIHDSRDESDHT